MSSCRCALDAGLTCPCWSETIDTVFEALDGIIAWHAGREGRSEIEAGIANMRTVIDAELEKLKEWRMLAIGMAMDLIQQGDCFCDGPRQGVRCAVCLAEDVMALNVQEIEHG